MLDHTRPQGWAQSLHCTLAVLTARENETDTSAFTTVLEMWGRWSLLIFLGLWGPIANANAYMRSPIRAHVGTNHPAARADYRAAKGPGASSGSLTPHLLRHILARPHGPPWHCKRVPTASCVLPHARGNSER
jgi:hypothetical protein